MNTSTVVSILALALASLAASGADAARMGGGRSFGAQRSVVPQRVQPAAPAAAPAQAAPSSVAPAKAPAAAPAATPAPARGMSRWLGPLAGIAAGLGLAALLSHFGLGADFGGLLLLLIVAVAGFFLIRRLFFARNRGTEPAVQAAQPMGFGAAEPNPRAEPAFSGRPAWTPRSDPPASNGATYGTPATIAGAASAPAPSPDIVLPPGFDAEPFLRAALSNFNRLQHAFDENDRSTLADVMTPELYQEVSRDLDQRATHVPTQVVKLDANMVDVATEGDRHWASVRFSGLLREDGSALPHEFEEVWNLTKPVDDSHGWLLAGIQQVR